MPYLFFVYNSGNITDEDYQTFCSIQDIYPEYEIVMTDISECGDAAAVSRCLQEESERRMTNPSGIQIFGTPDAVPSFTLRYETEGLMSDGTYELQVYDDFQSDYFYSNFSNAPEDVDGISAYHLSKRLSEINIVPEWPVIRLPLAKGEYSAFAEKYREYLILASQRQLLHISIASAAYPVGWYPVAVDDMNWFLTRARDEFGILDNLRIYGTTKGVYASTMKLDGSIEAENWAYLTETDICEILHGGHAGKTSLLETVFYGRRKDEYENTPILSQNNINSVLNGLPYFLFSCGCQTARNMSDNIITTALSGRCVGAIASTTPTSFVDIDCMLSEEEYEAGTTIYTFLYEYLLGRHHGLTRTGAFFEGMQTMATNLLSEADTMRRNSLESGLHNLLGFQNFGLFDP